jgi:SAM-dependent methyltransferase
MRSADNAQQIFPEISAGGFSSESISVEFFTRINALLRPQMRVLDLGAGRGRRFDAPPGPYLQALFTIQGKVQEFVGADPDHAAILANRHLDRAVPIEPNGRLPFADAEFDLIICDWVLEHVTEPDKFAREVLRVLRPGGWFCARTPNRWGLTALGASVIPGSMHRKVLRRWAPQRKEQDIFPAVYLMNTQRQIRKLFPDRFWLNCSYMKNGEPTYFSRSRALARLALLYGKLAPKKLSNIMLIFLKKQEETAGQANLL